MGEKNIVIVSGGTISRKLLVQYINVHSPDIIIAVDGGLQCIEELNLPVHYIVGDFDTIEHKTLQKYKMLEKMSKQGYPKILSFNPEKDDTDTEIALRLAVSLKPSQIILLGGTGTRLDHTFANIHLLKIALDQGIEAYLLDEHNKVYLIRQSTRVKHCNVYGNYISILPFTTVVRNITLHGLKYPLTNHTMQLGTSLGISNEIIANEALIEFEDGILIVIESKD